MMVLQHRILSSVISFKFWEGVQKGVHFQAIKWLDCITKVKLGDIILTKSILRFARNTVDLLETVRYLKEVGIEV